MECELLLIEKPNHPATFLAVCSAWYWLNQTKISLDFGAKMAVKAALAAAVATSMLLNKTSSGL